MATGIFCFFARFLSLVSSVSVNITATRFLRESGEGPEPEPMGLPEKNTTVDQRHVNKAVRVFSQGPAAGVPPQRIAAGACPCAEIGVFFKMHGQGYGNIDVCAVARDQVAFSHGVDPEEAWGKTPEISGQTGVFFPDGRFRFIVDMQ